MKQKIIKNLLSLTLLLNLSVANAAIITGDDSDPFNAANCSILVSNAFECAVDTLLTTTSLPTIIIDSQELDLNSKEASLRLVAEANGDVEPVMAEKIAQDQGKSTEEILSKVRELSDAENFSTALVIESLN